MTEPSDIDFFFSIFPELLQPSLSPGTRLTLSFRTPCIFYYLFSSIFYLTLLYLLMFVCLVIKAPSALY